MGNVKKVKTFDLESGMVFFLGTWQSARGSHVDLSLPYLGMPVTAYSKCAVTSPQAETRPKTTLEKGKEKKAPGLLTVVLH